ncbi:uncharacterized protein O3C94_018134 [Discoglossus pictus]
MGTSTVTLCLVLVTWPLLSNADPTPDVNGYRNSSDSSPFWNYFYTTAAVTQHTTENSIGKLTSHETTAVEQHTTARYETTAVSDIPGSTQYWNNFRNATTGKSIDMKGFHQVEVMLQT